MAGICCGVVEGETAAPIEPSPRPTRSRLDLLPLKYIADMAVPPSDGSRKRPRLARCSALAKPRECRNAVEISESSQGKPEKEQDKATKPENELSQEYPKFGVTSVCGRRRDMEDTVSVHPSFCHEEGQNKKGCHFFGVFDGHGCSHVIFSVT